jgi:Amt family ammonium transporter
MQAGFALLEVGSVQMKNAKSILIKNLLDGSVGSIAWWTFGYGIAFGGGGAENPNGIIGTTGFFLNEASSEVNREWNAYISWTFQWAFATTSATIVSGCVAERMNPSSYLIFSAFITAFFYPVIVHWVWSDNGWLNQMGFHDFAGKIRLSILNYCFSYPLTPPLPRMRASSHGRWFQRSHRRLVARPKDWTI